MTAAEARQVALALAVVAYQVEIVDLEETIASLPAGDYEVGEAERDLAKTRRKLERLRQIGAVIP